MSIDFSIDCSTYLKYANEETVNKNIEHHGFINDEALKNLERSDLTTHIYEGGFKVWECSLDMCKLMRNQENLFQGKVVMELGCGAGLPGIFALRCGASRCIFQDFNNVVVECFTRENLILNDVQLDKSKLIGIPWSEIHNHVSMNSVDIILTSETIYNEDDYDQLHMAINHSLSTIHDGFVWIAAKSFYFGVGGSVASFIDFVIKQGLFTIEEIWAIDEGVSRRILEMRRIHTKTYQ